MPRNELRTLNLPIADELARRTGVKPRVRPDDCTPYAVADAVPKLVFSPRTATEAAKTITLLAQEGASIVIRGAGTKRYRPPAPHALDAVLDTARCSGINAYEPADLTVTVASGTPLAELQAALRQHHQFFPVDPPFATEATIGGMLAARSLGALRQQYGSPRDNVLGMRVCLSDGSVAFTGAKVVKSVAGYDIAKLFVGSYGTLGFIADVTLKVAPLPAEQLSIVAVFARVEDACAAANAIASGPLFPLATALLDGGSAALVRTLAARSSSDWTLVIRCGGSRAGAQAVADGVTRACRAGGARETAMLDADRTLSAWTDIPDLAGGAFFPASRWVACKVVGLPSDSAEVCKLAASICEETRVMAHPTVGAVFVHFDARQEGALSNARELESICSAHRWTLEYLGAPADLGAALRQPIPDGAPLLLARTIKAAFDPTGTFDPGRLAGGI